MPDLEHQPENLRGILGGEDKRETFVKSMGPGRMTKLNMKEMMKEDN
jgi:hypothetical protein